MKSNRINYLVVGTFVIAMLVATVVAVAMLTGRTGATDSYFAEYRNVTGIKFGTQVVYEGYPVGQVEQVTPVPDEKGMKFRVDFEVIEGWRIPRDSRAEIAAPGLLAAVTISIRAGRETEMLAPGERVASAESSNLLAAVSTVADELNRLARDDIRPLIANLNGAVNAFSGVLEGDVPVLMADLRALTNGLGTRLPALIKDLETFTRTMNDGAVRFNALLDDENRELIGSILVNVDKTARTMNDGATRFSALLDKDNRERVGSILVNMDKMSRNVNKITADLTRTQDRLDKLLGSVDAMAGENREDIRHAIADLRHVTGSVAQRIDAISQDLEGTARNMNEFSRRIRNDPSLLVGGSQPGNKAP